jgi:hypothetical protein
LRCSLSQRTLETYVKGLEIYKELVRVDPKNALFRQGLAIAYANTAVGVGKAGRKAMSLDYMEKSVELMRAAVFVGYVSDSCSTVPDPFLPASSYSQSMT